MKFSFDGDDIHYIAEDWFEIIVANQDENKHLDAETLGYISRVMLDCPSFKKEMNSLRCKPETQTCISKRKIKCK